MFTPRTAGIIIEQERSVLLARLESVRTRDVWTLPFGIWDQRYDRGGTQETARRIVKDLFGVEAVNPSNFYHYSRTIDDEIWIYDAIRCTTSKPIPHKNMRGYVFFSKERLPKLETHSKQIMQVYSNLHMK